MHKLLILEDRYSLKSNIVDICRSWSNDIEITIVSSEAEAVELLDKESIALAIIDLSSGYGLHAENLGGLTYRYPHVPCIAILDKQQDLDESVLGLGASNCLHLPISDEELRHQVDMLLNQSARGVFRGIYVHSLLQMFENDEITCTLKIAGEDESGIIYIENGIPVAAESEGLLNEDAMYSLVTWEDAVVEMHHYNGQRTHEIKQPLLSLIIDAFRIKDENQTQEKRKRPDNIVEKQIFSPAGKGNRIPLEIGAKLSLELNHLDFQVISTVVGMIPNRFILVTPPQPTKIFKDACEKENSIVVKFLYMGQLYMFNTSLKEELHSPENLIFLDYPPIIQYRELRRAGRATVFVPAALIYGEEPEVSGIINDISSIGCLFSAKTYRNLALPNFDIDSQIELTCSLPCIAEKRVLKGKVKNTKKSEDELQLGLQFDNLDDDIQKAITDYVQSIEQK